MTPLIAWFLWIGMVTLLVLVVIDVISNSVARKVLRHIEIMEEELHQQYINRGK